MCSNERSESWLLADQGAWVELGLKNTNILPRSPETIWGARHDPTGNHPHHLFARVCEAAGVADARSTRVLIANASAVQELESRCARSFGQFAADLRPLIAV
jgi:hypothetical protein